MGDVTGNLTGDVSGNITGTTATFSGNVTIGGTLTYEDVNSIDSIGIVTIEMVSESVLVVLLDPLVLVLSPTLVMVPN